MEAVIEVPPAEAWDIKPSEHDTLQHRSFVATPREPLIVDYHTFERYHDQTISIIIPVEVVRASLRYYWRERQQDWEEHIELQMFQLNPKTMERYSHRNPKSSPIYTRDEGVAAEETIKAVLREATKPTSRIVIQEITAGDDAVAELEAEVGPTVRLLEALPEKTARGFRYVEIPFRDYHSSSERKISIQESSSASEYKLWVGFDTVYADLNGTGETTLMERGHLGEAEVRKMRDALTAWLEA